MWFHSFIFQVSKQGQEFKGLFSQIFQQMFSGLLFRTRHDSGCSRWILEENRQVLVELPFFFPVRIKGTLVKVKKQFSIYS